MLLEVPGPLLLLSPSCCSFFSSLEVNRNCGGDGTPLWDLLGDVGLQGKWDPSPLHPRWERDTRALPGWRKRTSCSSLWYTPCLPPPAPPSRSHLVLTRHWQLAGLGCSSPKGKGVSDPRRSRLELGACCQCWLHMHW